MCDSLAHDREVASGILAHPVACLCRSSRDGVEIALSIAGDPPRARAAWIDSRQQAILARIACPPGRPSRGRPVVATVVDIDLPDGLVERVALVRATDDVVAVRVQLAAETAPDPVPVCGNGLALAHFPAGAVVTAIDALDPRGEPVGRLVRAGISELRFDGAALSGRLGATHGMSAGFGSGSWARSLAEAAFEAGFEPLLPTWLPSGLTRTGARVEPDLCYPSGPAGIAIAWEADEGAKRVLLRQTPAPLASPPGPTPWSREEPIGEEIGHVSGRRLGLLVWEREDLAFGIQVRGLSRLDEIALRVARSLPRP